jgi:hypothetical protein
MMQRNNLVYSIEKTLDWQPLKLTEPDPHEAKKP